MICSCIGNALCRPVSRAVSASATPQRLRQGVRFAATPSSKDHALFIGSHGL